MSHPGLAQAIRERGLEPWNEQLQALAQNAIVVRLREDEAGDEAPLGASRLGGLPDLPPETPWPTDRGVPLVFRAQFDLAELAAHDLDHRLPERGLLSLFTASDCASLPLAHAVLYFGGEAGSLLRTSPPTLAPPTPPQGWWPRLLAALRPKADPVPMVLPAVRATFRHYPALPAPGDPALEGLGLTPEQDDAYSDLELEWCATEPSLLGHPQPVQNDPREDVPEAETRDAGELELLYQEPMEGLYFLIPRAALQRGDFRRTWCVYQFD